MIKSKAYRFFNEILDLLVSFKKQRQGNDCCRHCIVAFTRKMVIVTIGAAHERTAVDVQINTTSPVTVLISNCFLSLLAILLGPCCLRQLKERSHLSESI